MVRYLSAWLFGATVICGCAEPAKTVPETTAAATNQGDEASGEPGGAKGGDSDSTTTHRSCRREETGWGCDESVRNRC